MTKSMISYLISFIMIYFGISGGSPSAMMISLNVERLTDASGAAVMGRVTGKRSLWSADGSLIVTRVTVAVQSTVKGKVNQPSIVIEHFGGEVGEIGMRQTDQPDFTIGEHVILFLQQTTSKTDSIGGPTYKIVGSAQGKYSISTEGAAVRGGFTTVSGLDDPDGRLPVESLLDRIRDRASGR